MPYYQRPEAYSYIPDYGAVTLWPGDPGIQLAKDIITNKKSYIFPCIHDYTVTDINLRLILETGEGISMEGDPRTPTIPSPSIIKVSEIPWFIVGLLVSIIGNQLSLINTY